MENYVTSKNSKLSAASFGKIVPDTLILRYLPALTLRQTGGAGNRKSKIGFLALQRMLGIGFRHLADLCFTPIWLLVFGSWFFISCEPPVDNEIYEEKLVVFGNLVANSPIVDTLFVSMSYTIDDPHEAEEKWVKDAIVTIISEEDTFVIPPVSGKVGRYLDTTYSYIIQPNRRYELDVTWNDYHVTSSTFVPDTIQIESVESTAWECEGESVVVSPIDLHLDENNLFVIEIAMETGIFTNLVMDTVIYREGPCYTTSFASVPMFVVKWETEVEPGMIRAISFAMDNNVTNSIVDTSFSANTFKGPMNVNENGDYWRINPVVWNLSQPEIHFGWLFFNYYGPHLILIQATDHAFSDYFEGDPFRQNQFILPNSNIEGGYGLFSSVSMQYFLVYVAQDENED